MKSVLVPVGEVLCSRGNTWHHYLPACPLSTVEDSTHRRNQQPEDFSWADLGTLLSLNSKSFLSELLCVALIATLQNLFQLKSVFLYSSNLQRAWCGRGHERRMAKCPSTKKCRPHKNISCFQRYE